MLHAVKASGAADVVLVLYHQHMTVRGQLSNRRRGGNHYGAAL
jgi:hypothetical protein